MADGTPNADTIYGTTGSDSINGLGGSDQIFGYSSTTNFLTEDGSDFLDGGAGNDTIFGGTGNDVIFGGDGDDTLHAGPNKRYQGNYEYDNSFEDYSEGLGSTPSDVIFGGSGNDTLVVRYAGIINEDTGEQLGIQCMFDGGNVQVMIDGIYYGERAESIERLVLTSGDKADTITATDGNDDLRTGDGADVIRTLAGDDIIIKGSGYLDIDAGEGNDTLYLNLKPEQPAINFNGVTGALKLGAVDMGSALNVENYFLTGTHSNDTMLGSTNGRNNFAGGDGNDTLTGGTNNDTLIGNADDDRLIGNAGNDWLTGGTGVDYVDAGDGDDHVWIRLANEVEADETYKGGGGTDTLHIDFSGIASFNLGSGDISGFEVMTAEYYPSDSTPYTVKMKTAQLLQFKEIDFAFQTFNNVTFALTDNADMVFSNAMLAFRTLQLANGGQLADFRNATGADQNINVYPRILGGNGDDTIFGRNQVGLSFAATGGAGNDTLIGGSSSSTLNGGEGNDTLKGGSSANDTVSFIDALKAISIDLTITKAQVTGSGKDKISGFENASGGNFNDRLLGTEAKNFLSGSGGNDLLRGGAGADALYGGDGLDTASYEGSKEGVQITLGISSFALAQGGDATGDTGNSIENLLGSAKNDVFIGNDAVNVLHGGAGHDSLAGGGGADDFMFSSKINASKNLDTITDFESGVDQIGLSDKIFAKLGNAITGSELRFGATAKDKNDFLIYDKTDGELFYDIDGSGKKGAVQFAQLAEGTEVAVKDLFLF